MQPASPALPAGTDRPARRRTVWLGALLLILLAVGAGASYLYCGRWVYHPTAHRHVPAGTTVAVRGDAAKVVLFKPVREHLWPAIEQARSARSAPEPAAPAGPSRLERIQRATGIRIPEDLRELIVASVDATRWVVLVGGPFPRGQLVDGLEQVLEEDGFPGWSRSDELLIHALGPAVGQADDGTIVIGTDPTLVRQALPAAEPTAAVPLPVDGALSFLVSAQAWGGAVSRLPLTLPGLGTLGRVDEARGNLTLSEQPQIELTLVPAPGTASDALSKDVERAIGGLRTMLLLWPGDLGGAKRALGGAAVESRDGLVRVVAPWPYDAIDDGCRRLGEWIRTGQTPSPAPRQGSWLPW